MKIVFTLMFAALTIISCKKKANDPQPQIGIPEISVLTPRCEGGTVKSVAIPFNLTHNGAVLSKVELYRSPSTKVSELTSPANDGMYTLYQTNTTCPVQSDNASYYFVITKSDNTQITTTAFPVYF